jgi:hypothetical protein
MSRGEWTIFPYEARPSRAEFELPVEYTVPHPWGTLQVTEAAHQAYGLNPLVTTTNGRLESFSPSDATPRVDVLLTAPQEHKDHIPTGLVATKPILHKEGVRLIVSLGNDKTSLGEEFKHGLLSHLQMIANIDDENILEHITDYNGVSALEAIQHEVPQAIAHGLATCVKESLVDPLASWEQMQSNKKFLGFVARMGSFAVSGSALILTAPDLVTPELPMTYGRLVAPAAFTIGTLALNYRSIRRWLQASDYRTIVMNEKVDLKAMEVSESIHETYCREYFDEQFEQRVNGTTQ